MSPGDDEPTGRVGTVTIRIRGGDRPGEVAIPIRGGTEAFIAYAEEEIARHETVLVYADRGNRAVDVMVYPAPGPVPDLL